MARSLFPPGLRLIRSHPVIFGVLVIWAFAPLATLLVHVGQHGGVLTGANGADAFDQFQYLAWIHDEGTHGLASNLWHTTSTPHDYVQPMYLVSGLLWRLGTSIQVAYLIWKPVAVLVLFLGFAAYVRHLLPESRWQQAAALVVALFYLSPVLALASWTNHISPPHRFALTLTTDDADSALGLWGFDHTAIAIGLMPVFLLAGERILTGAPRTRRAAAGWTAVAALAGLLVSWLHPWQGVMLLAIVGGLFVVKAPRRRYLKLAVPVTATLAPLIYGVALSRWDPSWHSFQAKSIAGTAPWWALLASFGPLVAIAVLGVRRSREERELMLVGWVLACTAVYFVVPQFPPHALSGVTLPLGILAVRGWQRARLPRRVLVPVGIAAILAFSLPAAIRQAQGVRDQFAGNAGGALSLQMLRLTNHQAAAFAYLAHAPRPGAVLAPWLLSMSVPGLTGRQVYAGHPQWQPAAHVTADGAFYDPALRDPNGALRRAILKQSKARFVIADCGAPAALGAAVAPVARAIRRFGCVTLYEVG